MAEINNVLRYSTSEDPIKIYNQQTDITGDDVGLRIQVNEDICYLPCVDITSKRASKLKVQTNQGAMAVARHKRDFLTNVSGVVFTHFYFDGDTNQTTPSMQAYSSSLVSLRLNCNVTAPDKSCWYYLKFIDAWGNELEPDENFDINILVSVISNYFVNDPRQLYFQFFNYTSFWFNNHLYSGRENLDFKYFDTMYPSKRHFFKLSSGKTPGGYFNELLVRQISILHEGYSKVLNLSVQ